MSKNNSKIKKFDKLVGKKIYSSDKLYGKISSINMENNRVTREDIIKIIQNQKDYSHLSDLSLIKMNKEVKKLEEEIIETNNKIRLLL